MEKIYSVSEFNKKLKECIESNYLFSNLFLKGELSGVTYYKSGHLYFNLKDKDSQIKCVAFNYKLKRIPENLKDGDEVKIFCDVGLYETRGEVQILVRHIEKQNKIGELFLKLEQLKKEMEKQGYFSSEHKKKLPNFPKTVGIVTSYSGAALQDIIKTIKKRDDRINIYIYPAKVQGVGAKEEIVKGIEVLNKIEEIDFIIAGRGGGSLEDLWCFNEKEVALAFYHSKKPIISAVGHETDYLLSDLTADMRAMTPTQAVELSVPEKHQLKKNILNRKKTLIRIINFEIDSAEKLILQYQNNYFIKNFIKEIEKNGQKIIIKEEKLDNLVKKLIKEKENQLSIRIERVIGQNPMKILSKGYSITTKKGITVKNVSQVQEKDIIETKLKNGVIKSIVKELKIYDKK